MGPFEYVVAQIDGDYAHLRRIDAPEGEALLVARALLPFETDEGSRLRYEYGSYTLL
ncbi:MAG: chorismate--pyruvate lyase [Acutalibacteraceae bacterium]